jgi:hypothetical protein
MKKFIKTKIIDFINENSMDEIKMDFLSDEFKKETDISDFIIMNQNKAKYDIILFLIEFGFYHNTEYNIHSSKNNNFKPSFLDIVGSFTIVDFIKEFKKYISKKYNISTYSITDEMWDSTFNNVIKPNIIKILSNYNFELNNDEPFLYGQGQLLITLKIPDNIKYAKKYPNFIIHNPNKIISSKKFFGIEDRNEKRKFVKHIIDDVEYKFLINPIKQDKYFSSGDKGIFGDLFGGVLNDFLEIKNIDFENIIIQINKDFKNYNFVIGGDGFYHLDDVKKFKENEDFNIKKINNNYIFYDKLVDLKKLYKKLDDADNIKMIVFLDLCGNFSKIKNGGLVDINSNTLYYPYILKK